jgi:hypothetical protein
MVEEELAVHIFADHISGCVQDSEVAHSEVAHSANLLSGVT